MALLSVNRNPSRRDLLVFGIGLPIVATLVGFRQWRHGSVTSAEVIWAAGALVTLVFAGVPRARRHVYLAWMYAFYPVGFVVSHVVLALVYFLVWTPVAIGLKLFGKDPMSRRIERTRESYWVKREPERDRQSYFRQF